MIAVVTFIVGLGIGFAAGRVKDSAKLAAVKAEIAKVEVFASAEVKSLAAKIKAKL
jgi:hypothetical protein